MNRAEWQTLRAFAKTILGKAAAFDWTLQGLGMFRLYLSDELRLHVWDARFAVQDVSRIHTHPWHFGSKVLSGQIVDTLYEEVSGSRGEPYMRQSLMCGPGGGLCGSPEPVRLALLQKVGFLAGASYSLTAKAIHATRYVDGTITLVEREFLEDRDHAMVFWPAGISWVSAEPRRATIDEIETMAAGAISRIVLEDSRIGAQNG